MTSVQAPNMLPAASPSLHLPTVATVEYTRTLDLVRSAPVALVTIEAPQHSPPELYTLHASFLI